MLSDYQIRLVWEGLVGAEIRAAYFGELSHRLLRAQKWLTLGSLLLSSGAGVSFLATVPQQYVWVKPTMAFLAAGISLWSLVAKNERGSIDAADLHSRWLALALAYDAIWQDTTRDDAAARLSELQSREAELSKSSTSLPDNSRLMKKSQEYVEMHRAHKEVPA